MYYIYVLVCHVVFVYREKVSKVSTFFLSLCSSFDFSVHPIPETGCYVHVTRASRTGRREGERLDFSSQSYTSVAYTLCMMRTRSSCLFLVAVSILALMNAVDVRGASIRAAPRRAATGPRRTLMTSIMDLSDPYDGVYALNAHAKEQHDDFYQQRKVDVPGSNEVVQKFNDDSVVRRHTGRKTEHHHTRIHVQLYVHMSHQSSLVSIDSP